MTIHFSKHTKHAKTVKKNERSPVDIVSAPTYLAIPKDRSRDIIDKLPVYIWVHDENHNIVHANKRFREKYRGCLGKKCHKCIKNSDSVCNCCMSAVMLRNHTDRKCNSCRNGDALKNIHTFHRSIIRKNGSRFILKSSIEMDGLLNELKKLEEISEAKPDYSHNQFWTMCSSCKKIKDDASSWVNLETFLIQYFNVVISHGICQGCIKKLYPEINKLP